MYHLKYDLPNPVFLYKYKECIHGNGVYDYNLIRQNTNDDASLPLNYTTCIPYRIILVIELIRFWPTLHIFHYVHVSPQDATMVAAQVQLLALIEVDHRATKHTHTH